MKFLLALLSIISTPVICIAQSQPPPLIGKANIMYAKKDYADAARLYRICMDKKKKAYSTYHHFALARLASCMRILNKNKEAQSLYEQLLQSAPEADSNTFFYGQVLKENEKYIQARDQFRKLVRRFPDNDMYKSFASSCDSAIAWLIQKSKYEVFNLRKINSSYSEISPVEYKTGLVFSSNREELMIRRKSSVSDEPFYDIYLAEGSIPGKIEHISSFSSVINSPYHDAAPSFTRDYTKIYFTRGKGIEGSNQVSSNRLKLYCSENIGSSWKRPERFIFNDSSFSFAHPSIDAQGKMFFFVSDMPGGYGGSDIYVCLNVEGKWTNPINLGPVINTRGDELFPFYHQSGTLYFASNYHSGLGGFDLFEAFQQNGEWARIVNLKAPINSSSDDFSLYFNKDKTRGYFSSNRPGGLGSEDIYMIEIKK